MILILLERYVEAFVGAIALFSDFGAKLSAEQTGDSVILIVVVLITVLLLPISTTFVRRFSVDQAPHRIDSHSPPVLPQNRFIITHYRGSGTTFIASR